MKNLNKKILILIFPLFFLLAGCGTQKVIYRDSIRVEYREKIVKVPDTLTVEIEKEVIKNVTTDTLSTVETKYATSTALISKGLLFHSIENKTGNIIVPTEKEIVYRDSIIYKEKFVEKIKEVNKVTKWQKFKMRFFWLFIGLVVVVIGWRVLRFYLKKV